MGWCAMREMQNKFSLIFEIYSECDEAGVSPAIFYDGEMAGGAL